MNSQGELRLTKETTTHEMELSLLATNNIAMDGVLGLYLQSIR